MTRMHTMTRRDDDAGRETSFDEVQPMREVQRRYAAWVLERVGSAP